MTTGNFITRRYPHETYTVEFYQADGRWFWDAGGVSDNVRDDESCGFVTMALAKRDAARQCDESQGCSGRWRAFS
jgi:hypothetical protein